ncbi:MAG: hypothetical protein Q8S44_07660 [Flavobacteriaceae bacterium]|nr:hypothetical protein [Flavobacteriaceae bacterium]
MKVKLTLLVLLISFTGISQNDIIQIKQGQAYTKLQSYKRLFGDKFSKNDSLNFILKGKDTLVPFPKDYEKTANVLVSYEPKDSLFLEIYKNIVYKKFRKPIKESDNKLRMRYWKTDIRIYFAKSVDATVKKELKKFATYLSEEVDSLKITFVNHIEKSNYVVYGYNSKNNYKYEDRIKSENNDYYISWDTNQRIYNCKLQINADSFKNKEDLVIESKRMFLGSLGHFNFTSQLPKESLLSVLYFKNKSLTPQDLEILKYHYSYGICKGTDLETFEEQHEMAKKTFLETGRNMIFIHPKSSNKNK